MKNLSFCHFSLSGLRPWSFTLECTPSMFHQNRVRIKLMCGFGTCLIQTSGCTCNQRRLDVNFRICEVKEFYYMYKCSQRSISFSVAYTQLICTFVFLKANCRFCVYNYCESCKITFVFSGHGKIKVTPIMH